MLCYFTPLWIYTQQKIPTSLHPQLFFTTLRNQYKKVSFTWVDEYVALERSSEFIKTCHDINTIVQNTGGYASSINVKSESPNNTLVNIKRDLLMKSSHKKEIWCFVYQYAICLSRQNDTRLSGDVPYFLCHGTRPSYKKIKYVVWESTSSIDVLQERISMIYHIVVISWDMQLLQELLSTGIQTKLFYPQSPSCLVWWI